MKIQIFPYICSRIASRVIAMFHWKGFLFFILFVWLFWKVQKGCRFRFSCSSLLIFNHIRPSTCEEVRLFHSWINQKLKLTCKCAHFCKYVKSYPSCRVLVIRITHVTKSCPHGARCLFQIPPHMKLSCRHPSVNHMQLPPAPTQTGGFGISGILFSVFAKL